MVTASRPTESKANAPAPRPVPPLAGAPWKWATGIIMVYVIYGAYFIAQGSMNFANGGDAARIVFFHVPVAILTYVAYAVATWHGVSYLRKPGADADMKSAASMELGFVFCILATITGSIFAGVQWGSFWNWDPRETSISVMLLLYASYLVLRGAMADRPERRGRLCAVYAIVALVPATFLIWVVPRILESMHPTTTLTNSSNTSPADKMVLYPAFLAFTLLYIWLAQLRLRFLRLQSHIADRRSRESHAK